MRTKDASGNPHVICVGIDLEPAFKANNLNFEDIIKERINPIESDTSTDEKLDQWLLKNAKTNHHVSASCKMGPISDEMSVVDQYGNVHGGESLMVVDASIMPACIRANTNVTSMMIGERVSAFIAGE